MSVPSVRKGLSSSIYYDADSNYAANVEDDMRDLVFRFSEEPEEIPLLAVNEIGDSIEMIENSVNEIVSEGIDFVESVGRGIEEIVPESINFIENVARGAIQAFDIITQKIVNEDILTNMPEEVFDSRQGYTTSIDTFSNTTVLSAMDIWRRQAKLLNVG